jgi:hypothetical protein
MVHPWLNKQIKKCQIQFKNQESISTLRETKPANHQVQHLHVRPIKQNEIYDSTACWKNPANKEHEGKEKWSLLLQALVNTKTMGSH